MNGWANSRCRINSDAHGARAVCRQLRSISDPTIVFDSNTNRVAKDLSLQARRLVLDNVPTSGVATGWQLAMRSKVLPDLMMQNGDGTRQVVDPSAALIRADDCQHKSERLVPALSEQRRLRRVVHLQTADMEE